MPTTGVTVITVTQAIRDAGSRCGQSSALRMKAICSMTWSEDQTPGRQGHRCSATWAASSPAAAPARRVSDAALAAQQGRWRARGGRPRALFLASDEASFVNGAQLFVDNGFTAA